ncbi:MAG: flippase-like domain-containing protein [Bacteroidetes bacterium]|nr:flippase-like domain-containing protein [Bacteroidota bacterium]
MKNSLLNGFIGIVIAAIALYFGFRGIDLSAVYNEMKSVDPFYLYLTMVVGILSHWLRAIRWKLLLKQQNFLDKGVYPFFSATMVGYAINNVIPRGGEIGKAVYLSRSTGIDKSTVLGTVVLERLLDFIVLVLVFGLTVLLYREPMNQFFPGLGVGALVVFLVAGGAILVFTFLPQKTVKKIFRNNLAVINKKAAIRLSAIAMRFVSGIGILKKGSSPVSITVLSLAIFFCYILTAWIPLFSFGFQADLNLSLGAGAALMAISAIGMILPSPGGTGTFHFFCSAVLVNLFAVSRLDAMSYATTVHLLNLVVTGGLGVLTFAFDQFFQGKKNV